MYDGENFGVANTVGFALAHFYENILPLKIDVIIIYFSHIHMQVCSKEYLKTMTSLEKIV